MNSEIIKLQRALQKLFNFPTVVIKTKISEIVRMTHVWNNRHQLREKSTQLEIQII